jgi:hypothetical protein
MDLAEAGATLLGSNKTMRNRLLSIPGILLSCFIRKN